MERRTGYVPFSSLSSQVILMRSTVLKNLNFPGQNWRTFFNLTSSIAQIRSYNTIGKCQINFIMQAMDMRNNDDFTHPRVQTACSNLMRSTQSARTAAYRSVLLSVDLFLPTLLLQMLKQKGNSLQNIS